MAPPLQNETAGAEADSHTVEETMALLPSDLCALVQWDRQREPEQNPYDYSNSPIMVISSGTAHGVPGYPDLMKRQASVEPDPDAPDMSEMGTALTQLLHSVY